MTWLDLTENPEAVNSTFEEVPSLTDVEIVRVVLERDGPTVEIDAALNQRPDKISKRLQSAGANAVTLRLQLLGVESVSLEGWETENRATVEIRPGVSSRIGVSVAGPHIRLSCNCSWVRIAGLTAYRRESRV